MFEDVKGYSNSPMHMRHCVKEALWDASIDKAVSKEKSHAFELACDAVPILT